MIADSGPPLPLWLLGPFACLFLLMWGAVSAGLAYISGWQALARLYRKDSEPRGGSAYGSCSGWVGEPSVRYRGCLNVTVAREGLYVVPTLMFRFCHPPLLLPWSSVVGVEERETLFARQLEVRCEAKGRKLKLLLPPNTAAGIAAARGVVGP